MKSVEKILSYQKVIERVLAAKSSNVFEMENICLHRIDHIACYKSFHHALTDLIASGRVVCCQDILTKGV